MTYHRLWLTRELKENTNNYLSPALAGFFNILRTFAHTNIMNESVWSQSVSFEKRNTLSKDLKVNTVVIGAGLAGLLTAYRLKEKGIETVVIDADRICSGQTKNTTAKITSQHGLIYSKIEKYYGRDKARAYAEVNENAIENYRRIIRERNIDCDFEEQKAYLYSNDIAALKDEYLSAEGSGIDCYIDENINLPIKPRAALVFNNQAQFNPLKFAKVISDNLLIYEKTPATRIVENIVYTPDGKITAENIVVATHYPFINFPSMYFLRMSQERSYAIAIEKKGIDLDGMYIGAEKNSLSLRAYKDMIIIGDSNHRTGCSGSINAFDNLSNTAKRLFPNHKELARWSAQDCKTIDGIPYIGKFAKYNNNIFVATGFNKWGMTGSMASAEIITNKICGNDREEYEFFSPNRFNFSASKNEINENITQTVKGFAEHLKKSTGTLETLRLNTAGEIRYNGQKAGAYKNEYGVIYVVSLTCPHLKCKLNWNDTTKTWDCRCHGSRYSYRGELLDNPAQEKSILLATIK